MRRILAVLCVVSGLVAAVAAHAQTVPAPTWVFTTIDAVRRTHEEQLVLTGVLEGAAAPSDAILETFYSSTNVYLTSSLDACERYALLMMSKPGQYKLEAWKRKDSLAPPAYCRLTKVNP